MVLGHCLLTDAVVEIKEAPFDKPDCLKSVAVDLRSTNNSLSSEEVAVDLYQREVKSIKAEHSTWFMYNIRSLSFTDI